MNNRRATSPKTLLDTIPDDRARSYLHHCQGSVADASALYLWGIDMAAALHEVLSMTEVAVRGAIDRELRQFSEDNGVLGGEWIANIGEIPYLPMIKFANGNPLFAYTNLRRMARKQEGGRNANHPRSNATMSHGDLISQVMFGTWGAMLPDKDDRRSQEVRDAIDGLWENAVGKAFPNRIQTIRRFTAPQTIGDHVRVCATLRNRVNHVDSLLNVDVESYLGDTISPLLQAIHPNVKQAIMSQSRVLSIWQRRPIALSGPGLNIKRISRQH